MPNNTQTSEEKKSLGTENSSGSQVSPSSGFQKALQKNPSAKEVDGNPFGATIPDASKTPTGAPEAEGTGTSSPHMSENPDKV
ncbi:MAG: hypothetical protein ACHQM6_00110 [Candidatus Kapaibacterium sp.]